MAFCIVSAGASPRPVPRGESTFIFSCLGCELSSSTRAQGDAGQPLDRHTLPWTAPLLAEGGEKRRPGQPSPTVGSGPVCTMAWTPLLLVLLSHCTGSLSQPVLAQQPSLSASPGATARLTCTLSSGFSVGGYYRNWFQQNPGSPPRYLLAYKSDSEKLQGSGVPSRFSGSKDASANAGFLTISGLQPEDEADYYCAAEHGSGSSYSDSQWLRCRGSETESPGPRGYALSLTEASVGASAKWAPLQSETSMEGGGAAHSHE
ncbi:immunoglobulin gamma-1 heavy chain-like [Phyllostomus hastatus]|uniref:immunoglobulin gamma-1 heavy chain-like n=1 Tax=Phyllostomus hastatus TaxID=9423 RepID=UPI001E683BD6|nr:immunoglobulin gamma-1 heavy chain-like [Phyllostomus hastatus]